MVNLEKLGTGDLWDLLKYIYGASSQIIIKETQQMQKVRITARDPFVVFSFYDTGTMYSATCNGWMEEPTFFMWMSKMFVPHVNETRESYGLDLHPAILFFDGHSSHISMRIVQLALENNVKLIKFPSHLTDKIQPLDVSVFEPLKRTWNDELVDGGKQRIVKAVLTL